MARFFREQDIDEFRDCFYLNARSGQIRTLDELTVIMRSLGMSPTITELKIYFKEKGGKISFADMLEIMHSHSQKENIPHEILRAFHANDPCKSGRIPARELRHILLQWGEKLSPKEGWCRHRCRCLRIAQMSSNTRFLSTLLSFLVISCITQCCYCHSSPNAVAHAPETSKEPLVPSDQRFFLQRIFSIYGNNGLMTFEGFEHLLQNLGLMDIMDHGLKEHKNGKTFLGVHPNHEHSKDSSNKHEERIIHTSPTQSTEHPHDHSDPDHDYPHWDHSLQIHKRRNISENFNITSPTDAHTSSHEPESKKQCLSPKEMYMSFDMDPKMSLNPVTFLVICPAIIYELDQCNQNNEIDTHKVVGLDQWLYAVLAVILISLCGLFSVTVIPIMQKWFYHTLLQFLVGLAIGSLSGDALLHLMPHAMIEGSSDDHHHGSEDSKKEAQAIWMGLCALAGIYIFFITERVLSAVTTYRRQNRSKRSQLGVDIVPSYTPEDIEPNGNVGEKLSQYRKNSYNSQISPEVKESIQMLPDPEPSTNSRRDSRRSSHEVAFHGRSSFSTDSVPGVLYHQTDSDPEKCTVTVSEHHGHGHGHSHEVPDSVSAVAWMVIMGDGLHNFCDGIAIGAAFATSIGDGVSTTVAVFCHELPHELGDFAMLLKTGMKVKQALMYNLLSSVLCLIGMVIGVSLGSVSSATMWIFAGTAGMFLYIALVDMLPELVTTFDDPRSTMSFTLAVQVLGITTGVCVMLIIALFEDTLKKIAS